jgi:phosphoserine phosphatase RsbU/P
MADVSGKGVPAALFMVISKTLIKDNVLSGKEPSEVFTCVNGQLCENNEAGMFVTAFMGILELSSGKFTYVNAGHNAPLIKKANGKFVWLKARPGFVLAGIETVKYRQAELMLERGDIFFTYTDGVTEALNLQQELYSDPRLESKLNSGETVGMTVDKLLAFVREDIRSFANGAEQADDITMLGLQYFGKE